MSIEYFFPSAFGLKFTSELGQVFEDVAFAYRCLEAEDWRQRVAATEVLVKGQLIGEAEKLVICKQLSTDRNESVRAMAIAMLARCGTKSNVVEVVELLQVIALESFRTPRELRTARRALAQLRRTREPQSVQHLIDDTKALLGEWEGFDEK